jgi:anti-sigma factor RsiW
MKCSEFHRQISLLIDGELRGPAAEALQFHLKQCPDCRGFHERMVAVTNEVKSIHGPVPSLSLADRAKDRVASERSRGWASQYFPAWSQVPLVALVVLLAIGLGNLAGRSVNEMLRPYGSEAMLEYVLPDQNGSLAEVVMDIGSEENSR